jgi:uncharacterized membrane protein
MDAQVSPGDLQLASPRWRILSRALRALTLLATVGASVTLYSQQIYRDAWVNDFIRSNVLDGHSRRVLILSMVIGAVVAPLPAVVYLLWRRSEKAVDRVRQVSHLISPFVLTGALPGLFRWKPWENEGTTKLLWILLVFVFVFERTARLSFAAIPEWISSRVQRLRAWLLERHPRVVIAIPLLVVIAAALFYGGFVGTMAQRLHHRLGTASFDLGYYDNLFFNSLHGHPMRCAAGMIPPTNWSAMRGHAELTTFLLLPLYALQPRADTLLWIQAFLIGSGAIPIYLLASRHISRIAAMVVALCYVLYPALQSANLYDFHMQPIAAVCIFWTLYFIDKRQYLPFTVMFILALGCREDISIGLATVGTVMLLSSYRPVLGLVMAGLSSAYFVVVRFYVMPKFGDWWFQDIYKDLFPQGDPTFGGVIKSMISNPLFVLGTIFTKEKLEYVLKLMIPMAFLPFRKTWLWVVLIPGMLSTVLTTGYGPTVSTTFQYVLHWVAYGFPAAVVALILIHKEHGRIRQAAAVATMLVGTLAASYNWGLMFQRHSFHAGFGAPDLSPLKPEDWARLSRIRSLIAQIPPDVPIAASEWEHPQISNRLTAYTLRIGLGEPPPEYILFKTDTGASGANQARDALNTGKYSILATNGEFQLLKRK